MCDLDAGATDLKIEKKSGTDLRSKDIIGYSWKCSTSNNDYQLS